MTASIIHVITHPTGGGAEKIVQTLSSSPIINSHFTSYVIYLSNPSNIHLQDHEFSLDLDSFFSLKAIFRLRRLVSCLLRTSSGSTIIHGHLFQPLYLLPLSLVSLPLTLVYTEHNTWNKRRRYPLLRFLEFFVYLFYQRIFCISSATRTSLLKWLTPFFPSSRLSTIYNGIILHPVVFDSFSSSLSNSPSPDSPVHLLSIGSLTHQKGFDISIQAISYIRHRIASYTILGSGPEYLSLLRLINDHGLTNIVSLPGYVSNIYPFIHRATHGLIPSRWEGFGLVMVEFLSQGKPVLSSGVLGLDEVSSGSQSVFNVSIDSPTSLSSDITRGIDQFRLLPEISKHAIQHAHKFSACRMSSDYLLEYEQLASLSCEAK